jgi:DNA mismatch repair ATPase MutL
MASQEPPVQFDENPKYEKIPEEQTIFNFNFDSNEQGSLEDEEVITDIIKKNIGEALKSADKAVEDEKREQKEESTQQVQNKQAELREAVSSQAKLEEEIVEVLAEPKSPAQSPAPPQIKGTRIKNPSEKYAEFEKQQKEEARVKE